jgi:hypothetical protein
MLVSIRLATGVQIVALPVAFLRPCALQFHGFLAVALARCILVEQTQPFVDAEPLPGDTAAGRDEADAVAGRLELDVVPGRNAVLFGEPFGQGKLQFALTWT